MGPRLESTIDDSSGQSIDLDRRGFNDTLPHLMLFLSSHHVSLFSTLSDRHRRRMYPVILATYGVCILNIRAAAFPHSHKQHHLRQVSDKNSIGVRSIAICRLNLVRLVLPYGQYAPEEEEEEGIMSHP
jgi:hypothetical protein